MKGVYMKRAISLVMALLFTVTASAVTINEVVYPTANKDYYKTGSDVVCIKGSSTPGTDVVIRVYDEKEALVYTDTLLAYENIDGNYIFTDFVFPKVSTSGQLAYKVIVSEAGTADVAVKTIRINAEKTTNASNSSSGGNGGFEMMEPWDKIDKTSETSTNTSTSTDDKNASSSEENTSDQAHKDQMNPDNKNDKLWKQINGVSTEREAASAISKITQATDKELMKGETAKNNVAVAGEVMTSNISAKRVNVGRNNKLSLTEASITSNDLSKLDKTMAAIEKAIADNNITLNREMNRELVLNVSFNKSTQATITIAKALVDKLENVDVLTICDADFRISYNVTDLKEMLGDKDKISLEIDKSEMIGETKKITVNFDTDRTQSVKIAFPNLDGNTQYMAIVDENGNPIGGHYNFATGVLEAKITESGIYRAVNNEKDFKDIKNKSNEMQESIKILAAKGVIQGTSETTFSPDETITRAEVAALLLRVLSEVDPNADGGFEDVTQTDWFYGTAGSAKEYGMIKGFEDNTFRGNHVIEKDQILTIASRVLQKEMKYKIPVNIEEWLKFKDADQIADWARKDIALTSMANIITKNEDNTIHSGESMTRGDAALIIMRLFYKIW